MKPISFDSWGGGIFWIINNVTLGYVIVPIVAIATYAELGIQCFGVYICRIFSR